VLPLNLFGLSRAETTDAALLLEQVTSVVKEVGAGREGWGGVPQLPWPHSLKAAGRGGLGVQGAACPTVTPSHQW